MSAATLSTFGTKPAAASAVRRLLATALAWYAERRTAAALARLDDHLLRDIGMAGRAHPEAVRRMLRAR